MSGSLTVGECALLYCILGSPLSSGKRYYPCVEESLAYIKNGLRLTQPAKAPACKETAVEQMTFF